MGHQYKDYELEVLRGLLNQYYSPEELDELLDRAQPGKTEYTGYGFFVTVQNSIIGSERRVCSESLILGESGGALVGFVAFLDQGELTLETFPINGQNLPATFRDGNVEIRHKE